MTSSLLVDVLAPLLLFLVLPFAAQTLAALPALWVHRRLRTRPAEGASGPWLADRIGIIARVGVSPEIAGHADGYWPNRGTIGLSPSTWADHTAAGRTIAAHEYGHARFWYEEPVLASLLLKARQIQHAATLVSGACIVVGVLMAHPGVLLFGFLALGVSVLTGLAVVFDEVKASLNGRALLASDGVRSSATDGAMALAALAYGAPVLARAGFLFVPGPLWRTLDTVRPQVPTSDLAIWSVLLLAPLLLLRTAQVLSELSAPQPMMTEFHLDWNLFRERGWEFHAGVIVLAWLGLSVGSPLADGLAPWFALGAIPAMTTLGGLGRLFVLLPVLTVFGLLGHEAGLPRADRTVPAEMPALDLVVGPDNGLQRSLALVRIAWLPLLLALLMRAPQAWS